MVSSSFASLMRYCSEDKSFHLRAEIVDVENGKPRFGMFPKTFFLHKLTDALSLKSSDAPRTIFGDCQDELLDLDFECVTADSDFEGNFSGEYEKENATLVFGGGDLVLTGTLKVVIDVRPFFRQLDVVFSNAAGERLLGGGGAGVPFENFCDIRFVF